MVPLRKSRKCPVCGKPSTSAYFPFDSKRCADIDLGKWLTGGYVIPAAEEPPPRSDEEDIDGEDRAS